MSLKCILIIGATFFLTSEVERVASKELLEGSGTRRYSEEFYNTIFEITPCCKIFKNFTLEDVKNWADDLSTWEAPAELLQKFPFYQAGYGVNNRPVWVFEFGKYDFKEQVSKGKERTAELARFMYQCALIMMEEGFRGRDISGTNKNITQGLGISDLDEYQFSQFTHRPTITALLETFKTYSNLLNPVFSKLLFINVGFDPNLLKAFGTPLFGPLAKKMEIFGRMNKWEPVLKKLVPDQSLPTWYGGSKDFKPVKVYG
ncbi:unnamed protein product [Allacma fusca]|uniref:CRAL-TRIO domain-containing protein n=1 Tax=Allacma fusca TaxID=39272 RepID=A0A8J2J8K3_9HEXA|nr:unnamed protein product [Allacma fusca]